MAFFSLDKFKIFIRQFYLNDLLVFSLGNRLESYILLFCLRKLEWSA